MSEASGYDIAKILEQMRADYWRSLELAEEDGHAETVDYLAVAFGPQRFGLPAATCREVLKLPHIVRVPRLPPHLPGIINLRGEIVAVTDLRTLLALPVTEPTASFRLVVVADGAMRTALLVERIEGLRTIAVESVVGFAEGSAHQAAVLFKGKVEDGDGELLLLDTCRLLSRPELVVDQKQRTAAE